MLKVICESAPISHFISYKCYKAIHFKNDKEITVCVNTNDILKKNPFYRG